MKNNILTDLKTLALLFLDMRKARKCGTEIKLEEKAQIPVCQSESFYNTVEGCTLSNIDHEIWNRTMDGFRRLPSEEKHRMQFSPKDGEFVDRARVWKDILSPLMTEKQCHIAMCRISHWYIHIKQMRKEEAR